MMLRKNMLRPLFIVLAIALMMNQLFIVYAADNPVPAPTGPYDVGIQWRHWVDEARDEPYVEGTDAKREVIVAFLYPADVNGDAETAHYMDNREAVLPSFAALMQELVAVPIQTQPSDLDDFRSHAYPNAPLSGDQASYPVLIFSHGGVSDARMYTAQVEELASQGYIVAAINHVYGAAVTVLNDGTIAIPAYSTGIEGLLAASQIWSQDQIFVMDQLEVLNADDPEGLFTNHLDVDRMGVFGQSLGGTTSTITCFMDARCKAGINGDGPVIGDVIEQGLDQPFMYLLSENFPLSDPASLTQARGPLYEVTVKGFEHVNFGDFPLWPHNESLIEAGWLSNADGARSVEVTNAALVAFFDKYLKGNEDSLDSILSAYPEITVTSRNIPGSAEAVLGHHLQAIIAHDLDAVMSDYANNAVLFTPNGVFSGHEQIRAFFAEALNIFTPEVLNTLKFERQDINGAYVYLLWSAGETIPFATDTFYIRDGKIVMQSFAAQFGG